MTKTSAAEQDYLKEIYLLHEDSGRATTQMLADRLGVKPPSVTAMIKRMADDADGPLVRHTPYHGVELTQRGLAVALEMLRHHRLIELFLTELLGVPWDQVHEEADRLEHVFSEDLEDRIAAKLGNPVFDPHGDPIPTREGVMVERELVRLTDLRAGASASVARIELQEAAVLQYLASLGLTLDARVLVEDVAPFGGVRTVRIGLERKATCHAIGEELAKHVLVMPWLEGKVEHGG
ncbi:MAG TPA: metal-dependent transcriptional regulator [Chloroflexota bacterium]|nr:metal-dependent transcriptional regulator [Chloroflexota bacterium]